MHMKAIFENPAEDRTLAEINFDPGNLNSIAVGFMGTRMEYPPTGVTYAVVDKKFKIQHGEPIIVFQLEEVTE